MVSGDYGKEVIKGKAADTHASHRKVSDSSKQEEKPEEPIYKSEPKKVKPVEEFEEEKMFKETII